MDVFAVAFYGLMGWAVLAYLIAMLEMGISDKDDIPPGGY
jgi:hypothetical protein